MCEGMQVQRGRLPACVAGEIMCPIPDVIGVRASVMIDNRTWRKIGDACIVLAKIRGILTDFKIDRISRE